MIRSLFVAVAAIVAAALAAPNEARADSMRIAYLSPSFDVSDAWERVFWAIQGRLEELGSRFRNPGAGSRESRRPRRTACPG